jgi:hypothetical protein
MALGSKDRRAKMITRTFFAIAASLMTVTAFSGTVALMTVDSIAQYQAV